MAVFATPHQVSRDLLSLKSTIKVYLRTRPLLNKEVSEGAHNILTLLPNEKQVLVEDGTKGQFTYDGVCEENATQEEVFQMVVSPLLENIHNGHNVTVMAYGQTGSGKTYTIGTNPTFSQESGGMLQRVMKALLDSEEDADKENVSGVKHNVECFKMSFLEVYNESVHDLFADRKIVETKPDGFGGVSPVSFKEVVVSTVDEGLKYLEKGNGQRKVAATVMNSHSSRSHAIISLSPCQKVKSDSSGVRGCLRMVDLAGAEGVGRNKTQGKGFCEGVSINKGLLAIGKVLAALSSNSLASHVPYRESMVTRLLRDALGGNSYTAMITCVSPASTNLSVTLNTLRYAEQARNIRNKPLGFSTLKRKGVKRGLEDVSATPNAWKKFVSGKEKSAHNATISTPGHKPPVTAAQPLNSTFVTPLHRTSDIPRACWPRSSSRTDLTAALEVPLRQPTFEEEEEEEAATVSPTHSIIAGPTTTNASYIQISPLVERVNSRLEQSILHGMKDMENRLAERVVNMLMGTKQSKRRSQRLQVKNESKFACKITSPNGREESLALAQISADSPFGFDDDTKEGSFNFADSIAEALMSKSSFKKALKGAFIKTEEDGYHELNSQSYCTNGGNTARSRVENTFKIPFPKDRKPLAEISNIDETMAFRSHESVDSNVPVTSTVLQLDKTVRRSARLSVQAPVVPPALKPLATKRRSCSISPLQWTCRNSPPGGADVTISSEKTVLYGSGGVSNGLENTVLFNGADSSCASPLHLKVNLLSMQRGNTFLSQVSPAREVGGEQKRSSRRSNLISEALRGDNDRRRSCRRSALIATQRNYDLLTVQDSPLVRRRSRKSVSKAANKSNISWTENKLKIVISPTLQKKHSDEILNILNTASLRELQKLPTIGPKTAMVIYNFRNMCGKLSRVEDIREIPGLQNSYCSRFMKANLIQETD